VSVEMAGKQTLALDDGSRFDVSHRSTATVTRPEPADARVLSCSDITITHASGLVFSVRSQGWFQRDRYLLEGSVLVDGRQAYTGRWEGFFAN
jgi:hypothetical protein